MENKQATLELIAPTIDEAVSKGLDELGLPLEAVDIEILDEGSKGLFGLGSRQARVRLTVKEPSEVTSEAVTEPEISVEETTSTVVKPEEPTAMIIEEDEVLDIARETVRELLDKMHVRADVNARYGEADDPKYQPPVMIDIHGDDLSILIGRRAATLNALQYITRLMVSKELGRSIFLLIDVEGYRARREQQLRRLANRMAEQAISTGRRQVLEPMPANERRIIHIELRENPDVSTESTGEDPHRKVMIHPLKSNDN